MEGLFYAFCLQMDMTLKRMLGAKEFGHERNFDRCMYATGTAKCPVKHYKAYFARRPVDMTKTDDPF